MINSSSALPSVFVERLAKIVPLEYFSAVIERFSCPKPLTIRCNNLKTTREHVLAVFQDHGVSLKEMTWFKNAFVVVENDQEKIDAIGKTLWFRDLVSQGFIYQQNLSSILSAVVLDPKSGDEILDMCAAPGSKTSQMAAMMQNAGKIIAIEAVKDRFYRLKSVLSLLDVAIVEPKLMDARRYKPVDLLFDRILVDAPCSSEGRFETFNKKSFAYWSPRKIKEMQHKQKGLLLNASRLLKPNGVLVYTTCTLAPEENEAVVDWVLRKSAGRLKLVPISLNGIKVYPSKSEWGEKIFDPQMQHCVRILPDERMEGFFIAKFLNV